MSKAAASLLLLICLSSSCAADAGSNPRCAAICNVAGSEGCTDTSLTTCVARCESRVADVPRLCEECLLDGARLQTQICPDGFVINQDGSACVLSDCRDGTCTVNGCTYPQNDPYSAECYPRVECELQLRPITDCGGLC